MQGASEAGLQLQAKDRKQGEIPDLQFWAEF